MDIAGCLGGGSEGVGAGGDCNIVVGKGCRGIVVGVSMRRKRIESLW